MLNREVLDAIESFSHSPTPEDVLEATARCLEPIGAEFFCFNYLPKENQAFEDVLLTSRIPPEWFSLYLSRNYARHDPALRHAGLVTTPFAWSEAPYDPVRDPGAKEVVERVEDFHLTKGLMVPVPSPAGCIGSVWLGGYDFKPAEVLKPLLHMISLYAFERIRALAARPHALPAKLSDREREVLTWTAAGKSTYEVGSILNLSHRTVEFHMKNVGLKLRAWNRTHAVAIAIRDRLIEV